MFLPIFHFEHDYIAPGKCVCRFSVFLSRFAETWKSNFIVDKNNVVMSSWPFWCSKLQNKQAENIFSNLLLSSYNFGTWDGILLMSLSDLRQVQLCLKGSLAQILNHWLKIQLKNTWLNRLYAVQRMFEMLSNLLYQGRIQEFVQGGGA